MTGFDWLAWFDNAAAWQALGVGVRGVVGGVWVCVVSVSGGKGRELEGLKGRVNHMGLSKRLKRRHRRQSKMGGVRHRLRSGRTGSARAKQRAGMLWELERKK